MRYRQRFYLHINLLCVCIIIFDCPQLCKYHNLRVYAQVLKRSGKQNKGQDVEDDDYGEGDCEGTVALYGQWQTEPLFLPPAVNGIVPKVKPST
uniref:DNA repair protein xp-C / rad4 n=1 Tax=Solanum tuberosum TaxID=4113 RepID=M1B9Z7_SOLTU